MDWIDQVEAKGKLWATPGKYLRESMLIALARKASDHFAPEAFWETTFDNSRDAHSPTEAEEDMLAHQLHAQMQLAMDEAVERRQGDEDDDEEYE